MRNFLQNAKGAVTVFVTLLLIPAMLVSGTAVDLARIHTAHSVLQDANQMAANSILTQYNTLLHDLYGVFGVAKDDPILGMLLDEYIKVSVFGGEYQDRSMGTLQLFYGADISVDDILFTNGKNLRNEDVLRRQIEEYMKFRGPVIIVHELLDALTGNKLKEDTAVISDKLEIESGIEELFNKYKELYDAINAADKCILPIGGISGPPFSNCSNQMVTLRSHFRNLNSYYSQWENEEDEEARADIEVSYQAELRHMELLIVGGYPETGGYIKGLNALIEEAKIKGDEFKQKFDAVVRIAREIDEMRDELVRKVDELERKVENDECSEDMKNALTQPQGNPPMTLIERYRDILRWENLEGMANAFKTRGYNYIDVQYKPQLDGMRYRDVDHPRAGTITREALATISSNPEFALSESVSARYSSAAYYAAFTQESVRYPMPPGFSKFAEVSEQNRAFFEALRTMMTQQDVNPVKMFDEQEDAEGSDSEDKQRNVISALVELVESAYAGLTNQPLGAMSISDEETSDDEPPGFFATIARLPEALSSPVMGIIRDPLGSLASVGDYFLLLTYCTSMFSNYTTTRPESNGKTKDDLSGIDFPDSITGVPISPEVNYFFQSEWEYLYEGNANADKNLKSITTLIFLVRMVCNYITVFSVTEITGIVTGIQGAFSWCPPLGLVLGELARAAFVALESLIDIATLRSGHKVPLIKSVANSEWVCSISGVTTAIANIISDGDGESNSSNNESGLTYSNYMLFFFLAKAFIYTGNYEDAATELAVRTANLIEWNVINYQNGINADEGRMSQALAGEQRFRLSDMNTDFSITTTARMRMLFLSMIFAQNFADSRGISMPPTRLIFVTDFRGY